MGLNVINELIVEMNEHKYSEMEIYLHLGIKAGFCSKRLWDEEKKQELETNPASAAVFLNYVKEVMKNKSGAEVRGKVSKNITYFSFKRTTVDMDEDMKEMFETIYSLPIENEMYLQALEKTRSNFISDSNEISFQAKYKMMEFSEYNKDYSAQEYVRALDEITYESFLIFVENLVTFNNSYLFLNGDLSKLEDSMFFDYIHNQVGRKSKSKEMIREKDIFLLMDQHLIQKTNDDYKLGCIRFDFLNREFSTTKKMALLTIIASELFQSNAEISLDELDASILYFNKDLLEYKNQIESCISINQDKLNQIKIGIISKYAQLLEKEPELFGRIYVEFTMIGSDVVEYLKVIEELDVVSLKVLYQEGDIKITEAYLVYTKEGE